MSAKIIYLLKPFQKAFTCPNWIINTLVMEEKWNFLGEAPGLGQNTGPLNYEIKIPGPTIDV
jgi:hypothetical protein